MGITNKVFGVTKAGKTVTAYTIKNAGGAEVTVMDYGARMLSLKMPDRNGTFSDVICGYDSLYGYENGDGYQGAIIGRFANRIANAKFTLDGVEYKLAVNDNKNSIHGGDVGFDSRMWDASYSGNELYFSLVSEDGEEGYPGRLAVTVTYKLTDDNRLSINYKAITDKKTVINMTNHSYFNLGGYASGKIFDQELWLDADSFLETDGELIPTGRLINVENTPFDFRTPKTIGRDFFADYEPLKLAGGYDHCFNFAGGESKGIALRGSLYDKNSGRFMELYTNQPCVQIYTANFMDNAKYPFRGGYPQAKQNAVCLETQHMPDGINHANFTDVTLAPGEVYDYTTIFAFSVK